MYSKVIAMGRLTADPELRQTPNGISVVSFRIAVNRPFTSKSGERATDFFNIVAWRGQAEFISKYFKKGNLILVDGRLETREYIDKNGVSQRIFEIVADTASFTGETKQSKFLGEDMNIETSDVTEQDFKELDEDEDLPF